MEQILVEEYRGPIVECVHRGHICGVGLDGALRYQLGDADYVAYLRSAGKPFQAIPAIKRGIVEAFEWDERAIALMTSSHRGEPFHVETLEGMASKAGLDEERLVCLPAYPLHSGARERLIRDQGAKRRLYHNCAGKHFGALALCKLLQYPIDNYCDPGHPVQQEILRTLSDMADCPVERMGAGTDGCGFPVYAMPLKHLAYAYLKLACPETIADAETREAVVRITKAMHAYPELVGGTGRIDSTLLEDPNIIAKGGFKGIFGFSLRNERLGFAFKVLDGSDEEAARIAVSILEQIQYANKSTIERIYERFPPEIRNDAGDAVGISKAAFRLARID
ncbi:asparaginase [Paenibacillus sp. CECT 9249]|uniref:asparaginase n=1 Tax=unclassified Paenibacillus TaxID=185978 RepID=UPI001C0F5587|nr:asparaginase [Paenibacillus sp. CECT 9249]MBU5442892.1 asparaginase [Paenibacillus sp. MSJ-34]CAH0119196.1 hypothetical protein PAE9249_01695 [Paenibacillus sp. CECT 9249]